MDKSISLKERAVAVISTYLGEETGRLYTAFYKDQPESAVLVSLRELLSEYLGEEEAKNQLTQFVQK